MTVDADGNLYIAVGGPSGSSGVYVFAPDGRQLAVIPTPETAVNVAFGRGADANLLYIVCSRSVSGTGLWEPPATNGLYRIRLQRRGVQGPSQ
jgi:sugar lactone lactonase YvrE